MYETITQSLQYLASVCKSTEDGHGFNKFDAQFGHSLARQSLSRQLTPNQQTAAFKMLKTYKNQLSAAGIELPTEYKIQENNSQLKETNHQIDSNGKQFVITLDYDAKLVSAVKALPNRKPKKVGKDWFWYVPLIETAAISKFAETYNFTLTEEAQQALTYLGEKKEENLAASKAYDADLEIEGLNGTLRPFQKAGVAYVANNKTAMIGYTSVKIGLEWEFRCTNPIS